MKNSKPKFIILSGFLAALSGIENATRHDALRDSLKRLGLKFKPLMGYYKGNEEKSFLVTFESDKERLALLGLANHFNQECVLIVNEKREASLVYTKGDKLNQTENIGTIKEISYKDLKNVNSYSYCPKLNRYYATEKVG